MRKINRIFIHTAAHGVRRKDGSVAVYDTTAKDIDSWHRDRGWNEIGYNYVIRFDGRVEAGRDLAKIPAQVEGFNQNSIGICLSGHGDLAPATPKQFETLVSLIASLLRQFGLDRAYLDSPETERYRIVLGHREVNRLKAGATGKTCPGTLVNCDAIRRAVTEKLKGRSEVEPTVRLKNYSKSRGQEVLNSFTALYKLAKELDWDSETLEVLNALRKSSDIDETIRRAKAEQSND